MKELVQSAAGTRFPFHKLRLATVIGWTMVAIGCLAGEYQQSREFLLTNAKAMAKLSFDKDLLFRRWGASHGGVYVPVSPSTQPNPYLKVPEREIATGSGRLLTLVNPAYMIRQLYELSRRDSYAPQGHITSLNPIRPENHPDAWESAALAAFERGVPEYGEMTSFAGKNYYRYMRPLMAEKACLNCHAAQGYREGQLRGGISVWIPLEGLVKVTDHNRFSHQSVIVAVWLIGLLGIWVGWRKIGEATANLTVERNNLTAIFDAAPVSMLLVDENLQVVRVNRAMQTNFSLEVTGWRGQRPGGVVRCINALVDERGCGAAHDCLSCPLNNAIWTAMQQGRAATGEACIVTMTGGEYDVVTVEYGVERIVLEGRPFVILSLADITEARKSQDDLKESELRYRTMVETLPVLLFRIASDGRLSFHDRKVEELCGFTKDEFASLERDWFSLVKEADRPRVDQALRGARIPGGECSVEFRIVTSTGKEAWLLAQAHFAPAAGESSGAIGVMVDITQQKQLEERYLHAQKLEAVGRLAGGIAHDFNNLLTVIMGNVEIVAHFDADPAMIRIASGQIMAASEKAAGLVRQLLAFSRKQVFSPMVLDLNQVIAGMEPMVRQLTNGHIGLVTDCASQPCLVMADKGQMEQVIMNLALNARDAMPEGGILDIVTSTIDLDATCSPMVGKDVTPGRYVLLSVTDSGVGIDAQTLSHIFDPFFTTKEVGKGTGLGLATVHGIVKQSGGEIRVYSEVGRGTTFRVYLPLYHGEKPHDDVAGVEKTTCGKGCILLVEDEDAIRSIASDYLNSCGYSVVTANSGEDALVAWEKCRGEVHLVITDLSMSGMDGYTLVQELAGRGAEAKVLFMSGYVEPPEMKERVASNEVSFLHKPFTMNVLATKVSELLEQQE
ncbi:DUF3365 domain-containing protein [Geomonas sp. Red32]|nr:DUF3365 domain-containing protein [Geomonas sp. Red32]